MDYINDKPHSVVQRAVDILANQVAPSGRFHYSLITQSVGNIVEDLPFTCYPKLLDLAVEVKSTWETNV